MLKAYANLILRYGDKFITVDIPERAGLENLMNVSFRAAR